MYYGRYLCVPAAEAEKKETLKGVTEIREPTSGRGRGVQQQNDDES